MGFGSGWRPGGGNGGSLAAWLKPSAKLPARAQPTMLTEFQAGHGWTSAGTGATFNLNDTTPGNFLFGTQGVTITTDGATHVALVKNFAISSTDFSASTTVVWLKCDDITHLKLIDIYWGDTSLTNTFYSLFIDGTLSNGPPIRSGEWVGVRVPRDNLTTTGSPNWSAITAMQVRVQDDNTGHPVILHVGGIQRIPDQTSFPTGVVSVVFDDGYQSQYTQGRLKLDAYGFPATAYVIVDQIDSDAGVNFLTSAQLTDLQNLHGWEIAAHAYTAIDHNAVFTTLSAAALDADAWQMKKWLIDNGYRGHNHLAYPGGGWSLATETVLKNYYATFRLLNNTLRQALPPGQPGGVVRLDAFEVLQGTTTAAIQSMIDSAYTGKTWLILLFHKIVTTPSTDIEYSIAHFATVVDYLNSKGIPVKTVGDVLASL